MRNYFRQLPKEKIPMIGSQIEYAQITILPVITEQEDMEVKGKLREFKRRVENGENFATLAVLYSEDPGLHAMAERWTMLPCHVGSGLRHGGI